MRTPLELRAVENTQQVVESSRWSPVSLYGVSCLIMLFGLTAVRTFQADKAHAGARAKRSLENALVALNSPDGVRGLREYRSRMKETDRMLRDALLSKPIDGGSISRLASIRWEEAALGETDSAQSFESLVTVAASLAPRVPETNLELGLLSLRTGNFDSATTLMRRALELSPGLAGKIIPPMLEAGFSLQELFKVLPRQPAVLLALRPAPTAPSEQVLWLQNVETSLSRDGNLLWAYSDVCLDLAMADRLLATVTRLGVQDIDSVEIARQFAIGRAELALGQIERSTAAAEHAREIAPRDVSVLEFAGKLELAAHAFAEALSCFTDALQQSAATGGTDSQRARLYSLRGQTLEQSGRRVDALDDYRHAFQLAPNDSWLATKLSIVGQ